MQSTKSVHSVAWSQARQVAEVIDLQSRPQSLTVSLGSQTSPASSVLLPQTAIAAGGVTASQVALQVLPAGVPAGKSVPSQASPLVRKPSPHCLTRTVQVAVQLPRSAGVGSHASNGTSSLPLPQTASVQSALHFASPALASHCSPASCRPLPHATLLQDTVVVSDLLHWPLLAVTVIGTSTPAPLQVKVVLAEVAAANEPT